MNNQDDDEFGDAIAFRGAPQESLAFAVLIAGLLGLALWAFLEDFGGASLIYRIFLLLALLLCLWPVASGIHNAFRGRRTMLAIGARGLFDWRISDDWVSWSSIAEVDVLRASKGCLVFYPDPNVPLGFREKILSRINRTLGDWSANPPLRVGMLGVGADLDQVVEALDRYFPQWRQRGGT